MKQKKIGEATIRAIVQRGGKVIIFDINEERGEAIAAELAGSAFWPGPTDVAGEDSVVESIAKGVKKFGKISGVVNCGGIGMAQKVFTLSNEMNVFLGQPMGSKRLSNRPSIMLDCVQEW